jgi:hypothetical protein
MAKYNFGKVQGCFCKNTKPWGFSRIKKIILVLEKVRKINNSKVEG